MSHNPVQKLKNLRGGGHNKKQTIPIILALSILSLATLLITPLGTPLVSAIQNIFIGLDNITDIKYGGQNIDKVYYRGEIIWERQSHEAQTGDDIQTVTIANCPANRTRVRDARDDATYWVQKMADGRCWMLTNLAYAGGGDNAYGDVKTTTNSNTLNYTQPYYMIPAGSNRTTGATDPSTSTSGTGQYGYLYNWCAAMGVQTATSACASTSTPLPDQNISICPSGWRLPTSNTGGEFQQLTDAVGATTNGISGGAAGSTVLRSTWLAVYSGLWDNGFYQQGSYGTGFLWSSTQGNATYGYIMLFSSSLVDPSYYSSYKTNGFAVRCIATT